MAPKFFFTSSFVVFLPFFLSSVYDICRAYYLPRSEKLSSPLHVQIKSLNGSRRGESIEILRGLKEYLAKLGYMVPQRHNHPYDDSFDNKLESAIKKYQKYYNLKLTGILDQETLELLSQPRCGVLDFHSHFNLGMIIWPPGKVKLSYSYLEDFREDALAPIQAAMSTWESVTPFKFKLTKNLEGVDVMIRFERRSNYQQVGGLFNWPDFPISRVKFTPPNGEIHFNGNVSWHTHGPTTARFGAYDLQTTALHAVGHILGLGHSSDPRAVMYAMLPAGRMKRELSEDDIREFKSLYHEYYN